MGRDAISSNLFSTSTKTVWLLAPHQRCSDSPSPSLPSSVLEQAEPDGDGHQLVARYKAKQAIPHSSVGSEILHLCTVIRFLVKAWLFHS